MKPLQILSGAFLALFAAGTTWASETEEKMTTVNGPLSITDFTTFKAAPLKAGDPETWGGRERKELDMPSPTERAAQLAKQRADKAHTVYKVNGKIVALHQAHGGITTASNSDGRAAREAAEMAEARGLTGDALNDFIADKMTASLQKKYGSALEVDTYSNAAAAPTAGEILDQMFGIERQHGSLQGQTSRVAMDTEHWAQLLEAYR